MPWQRAIVLMLGISGLASTSHAGDVRLRIPARSRSTPVQQLNREGVEAARKHQYDKAKTLFYRAYLFDPGDPFTLNNLGYVAEIDGHVEQAQKFYALAAKQATNATVDQATTKSLEGQPFRNVVGEVPDVAMQINRNNVEAIRLLSENRAPEADLLLQRTLALNPKFSFTLNNLGVAKEAEGDFDQALKYYTMAADTGSKDPVVVTLNPAKVGSPVSELAADSVKRVRERMQHLGTAEARASLLNVQAVAAVNRNDWALAERNFREAYRLDPHDAFALNNLGFLSEMYGDPESAQEYYEAVQRTDHTNLKIGTATRPEAEGMRLGAIAGESDKSVDSILQAEQEIRRKQTGPIELKHRGQTPLIEPATSPPNPTN